MSARSDDPQATPKTGWVALVGAGPGDPGLITLRGIEFLRQADVVVHDRLANRLLLLHAPQAEWIDVGKQPDHHPVPQPEINRILVEQARLGRFVVRLKGGDPFVFGRGGEEALALVQAGIPFEIVPGISSAIAAPAYAGIPVTQRNVAGSLAIIAGHRSDPGSDPVSVEFGGLDADTLVFLMGVQNLPAIVSALLARGRSLQTPAALIEQGTLPAQKVVVGTLADILELSAEIQPPAVTVVGEVVRLRENLAWFEDIERRPLLGLRILNTRPREARTYDAFGEKLRFLGAQVLEQPAFEIAPVCDPAILDRTIQKLAARPAWDWILFTSASAVKAFLDRIVELGFDIRSLASLRLGAVGEATVQALADYHLRADFTPARFTGADWAAEAGGLSGSRILLPRSQIATPDLVRALEAQQAQVETLTAYSIRPVEPDPEILGFLTRGELDWLTFFSPSAVHGLIDMLKAATGEEQAIQTLRQARIACVGPTTGAALRESGLQVDLTAAEHTVDGLVEALSKWRMPS